MSSGTGGERLAHAVAPPLSVPLRAGPVRLVFDRGALRWIRLGERELLRGIYVAVREPGWVTVPGALSELVIETELESFRIRFLSRHRRGLVAFDWRGTIAGDADGRILFSMEGTAEATFQRNRIGLCVLHPLAECAGSPCVIETTEGARRQDAFPRLVSPHQPFLELRAITHEVAPGVAAEVRMEGDSFETEDQRNWSDASFKTYSPPLRLPFPAEIAQGTRIRQTVLLRLVGDAPEALRLAVSSVPGVRTKRRDDTGPVAVTVEPARVHPRPAIGLAGGGGVSLDEGQAERLRALRLDHLRADLHLESPGWEGDFDRAASNAALLRLPLELALFLPDDAVGVLRELAGHAAIHRPRVASLLLFSASGTVKSDRFTTTARETLAAAFPSALVAGGTDGHFADLNRARPSPAGLDRLSFALTPQVHAFDDATLVESFASLPWLAATARSFAGAASLGISPVSLRPRVDKRPPASRDPREPPFTDDPRQKTAFGAAWTIGLVTQAAEAGFASLTLFELLGPRGVMEGQELFPVYDALAEIAATSGTPLSFARSRRPERVQALAWRHAGGASVLLANMTEAAHAVQVEGLAGSLRVRALGEAEASPSKSQVEIAPHAIVRLDAPEAGNSA